MSKLKEQILQLRQEGKTYDNIISILGCSKSTVSYYCGINQAMKNKQRTNYYRHTNINTILNVKIASFKAPWFSKRPHNYKWSNGQHKSSLKQRIYTKFRNYVYRKNNIMNNKLFTQEELINKIGDNPTCYLTGEPIDLHKTSTYNFDHVIPASRGGSSELDNLGICTKKANQMKSDMTPDELISMCKLILIHHGYTINKV